jgi:hypothetical protein
MQCARACPLIKSLQATEFRQAIVERERARNEKGEQNHFKPRISRKKRAKLKPAKKYMYHKRYKNAKNYKYISEPAGSYVLIWNL